MASRRSRIKGIANIPQRRKPTTETDTREDADDSNPNPSPKQLLYTPEDATSSGVKTTPIEGSNLADKLRDDDVSGGAAVGGDKENSCASEVAYSSATVPAIANCKETSIDNLKSAPATQPAFNRRRQIKPAISLKAIQKSSSPQIISPKPNEPEVPKAQEEPSPPENANCTAMTPNIADHASNVSKQSPLKVDCINKEISVLGITKLPLGPSLDNNCPDKGDEVARPPPACSPSKYMNRARIKAVPRLGQRRPSFSIGSASESEDESKKSYKSNRKRNDSVCSSVSAAPPESPAVVPEAGHCSPRKKQEFNIVIQRKCRRTEQSRKLAEARREFQLKFNNGKPDKQKLTMIDLIFYNPSSSPMSQKRKRLDTDAESVISQGGEEDVDDAPAPADTTIATVADAEESDEENTVPAPQITIGPNGEIVIDEKSLYVENKNVTRDREKLEKSNIVDGDEFDTGYGIYKRPKRSKDWSKDETLRFYKALNTLGTDFALMCGIFPGRSRRELKMKFNKEERTNRQLVDRAVMNPIQFDLSDLERDLAREEMEKARKEQLKKDLEEFKERRRAAKEAKEVKNNKENDDVESVSGGRRKQARRAVKVVKRMTDPSVREALKNKLQKGVDSLFDGAADDEETTGNEETTSNEEKTGNHETTGNEQKKIKEDNNNVVLDDGKQSEVIVSSSDQGILDDDCLISSQDIPLASSTQKEPSQECEEMVDQESNADDTLVEGSVILSSTTDENGQEVYKAYTVNNGEKVALELSPEILGALLESENQGIEENQDTDTNSDNPPDSSIQTDENQELIAESDKTITSSQSTQELLAILDGSNDSAPEEPQGALVIDEGPDETIIADDTTVDITLSSIQNSDLPLASADCMILSFDDIDTGKLENVATNIVAIDTGKTW